MKLADQPAYPCEVTWGEDGIQGRQTGNSSGICTGMTLRQYYAGLAMQGMLANAEITRPNEVCISEAAVKIADALLAELEK